MSSIRGPERGPILKPEPKIRGGKKPREAGRRYERAFAQKYGFKTVLGSGSFGKVDPSLQGDVVATFGGIDWLLEAKSLNKIDGRGEKIVNFPLSFIEKIALEAASMNKIPGLIYHPKGSSKEYIVLDFGWFLDLVEDYKRQIDELS